jgi:hypothetical protein
MVISKTGILPTGVTFTDNSDGTASLAGTPAAGTGGTYPITITASNGVLPNATQTFTITVDQAPAITSANSTTFTVGSAGTFSVTTTGFPTGASMAITKTGALHSSVTFTDNHNGTATLAGTPAAGTGGTYPITITASNGVSPDATQNFTLTVNQAPAITSASSTTFTVASSGTFTVTATGFPVMTLSETGFLPGGITFTDNGDGTASLTGTPAAGTDDIYPITITASNGVSPDATQNFTLIVNRAPAITSANSTTFTVNSAGTFTVTATGSPMVTLSETGSLPTGVTFADNHNRTASLTGTPAAGTDGTYSITITASNGVSPNATQDFTLTVNKASTTTAITSSVNPSVVGQSVTFTAIVSATAPGAGTPTGTVEFFDGSTSLGSGTLNGSAQATLSISSLNAATHSITATYNGNTNYATSTSSALSQVVHKASTTTALTSSVNPSVVGQSVTFTAIVSATAPGAGTPTGTVGFFDGSTSLGSGTLNGSGQASLSTSSLSVAGSPHSITATYAGNTSFNTSTSSVLSQVVNKAIIYLPLITVNYPPPPKDLALSNASIPGNVPVGARVGSFTTTSSNAGATFTYSLVSGAGSDNNASFTISGNQLLTAAVFDFNVKNSYSILVRTTDQGGLYKEKNFTITVTTNANPPTVPSLLSPDNNVSIAIYPTLTWSQSTVPAGEPDFDHYWVQVWSIVNGSAVTAVDDPVSGISNTSYSVPAGALVANTRYYWGVRSVNIYGQASNWPTVRSFSTIGIPPNAPFLVAPENNALVANTTPTLSWSQSTVPAGAPAVGQYRVQVWSIVNGSAVTAVDDTVSGITTTNYPILSGLAANTRYYWGVRSVNIFGQLSNWPTVRSFLTPP